MANRLVSPEELAYSPRFSHRHVTDGLFPVRDCQICDEYAAYLARREAKCGTGRTTYVSGDEES
jgi:hypothetical protein